MRRIMPVLRGPLSNVSSGAVWTAGDLLDELRHQRKLAVLDVRNRDEFERFPLEGLALSVINFPYFEMLESGGLDDMVDSVAASIERDLKGKLPHGGRVLAVCAKGDSSEYVRQALERLGYDAGTLKGGMKGWGNFYETRAVVDTPELSIHQISRPARGCLSYVIASEGKVIVIDPLRHLDAYLALARGMKIEAVIDTHGHADHISGGRALAQAAGAPYYLHPYDAIHPLDMLPAMFSYEPVRDHHVFRLGRHELRAIHVPGHTLGLVAFLLDDEYLFTGDSIFIHSIARPDLGGKAEAWAALHTKSLRKLLELPSKVRVLPGHFSSQEEGDREGLFQASLQSLKNDNKSLLELQRGSDAEFIQYLLGSLPKFVPEYVEIKRVNAGLSSPNEDDAAALELGKNVCGLAQAQMAATGESR